MIYVLLRRKIRLSNYQHYFIANVAVSDVLVSIAGVFRGLGIINSVFIGAPNQNTTINCALYTFFLNSFASSGSTALIPLTLDRAIAILLPLHHRSIVTKTTSVAMIIAGWLSVATVLVYESVAYSKQAIKIEYLHGYHRCIISEDGAFIGRMFLFVAPFFLILALYAIMMILVFRSGRPPSRFLITACGIILTNLLTFAPTIVTMVWSIPLDYKLSQILTVTLYYTNGIFNSIIYLGAHPAAKRYALSLRTRYSSSTTNTGLEMVTNRNRTGSEVVVNSCAVEQNCSSRKVEGNSCAVNH